MQLALTGLGPRAGILASKEVWDGISQFSGGIRPVFDRSYRPITQSLSYRDTTDGGLDKELAGIEPGWVPPLFDGEDDFTLQTRR